MNKKLLILISALSGALQVAAQPVLTEANFSDENESYIFSTATDPAIDFSSTGANYTWDFSYLTADGQNGLVNRPLSQAAQLSYLFFGPFASSQYQASYFALATDLPLDQITGSLPITIDEISRFTKNSSSAVKSIGYEFVFSGQGIPAKSDTIETRYALPLNYGDSYNSRGFTKLNMNPIYDAEWRQHRGRSSSVDGYGTVQTPWATFTALRIHHRIDEVDSFYVNMNGSDFWLPIPVPASHEYEWRSLDDKESVMLIKTSEVLGNEVVTSIQYRDDYNGLGIEDKTIEVSVSPNPVSDILTVQLSQNATAWTLVGLRGEIVKRGEMTGNSTSISMKELESGQYILVVETATGIISERITKK